MLGIKIVGMGKAVPDKVLTNDDLSKMVDTNDEWISTRTGIKERHIATTQTTESLATEAAKEAINSSGLTSEDIDLVIIATVSPEHTMPSTACIVAREIEAYNATCFDLTAACSGFITASEVAFSMLETGKYNNALVIGAEVLSKALDWNDRGTCVLFGDGAGAVVYSVTKEEGQILEIETGSDPKGADEITLALTPSNTEFYENKVENNHLCMNGRPVYVFATHKVPESIQRTLSKVDMTPNDVDHFILHQANARIIDSVANRLKADKSKFFKNLHKYGNTSAASIPMALYDAKDSFKKGDVVLLSGFGAGLTWGTMIFKW